MTEPATDELVENMRRTVRRAQLRLIEDPDASDPWWFLVDPDATNAPDPMPYRGTLAP